MPTLRYAGSGFEGMGPKLPSDVVFMRMPVVFGRSWEMHARMFWVAKNLGLLETIHEPLFNAIHREGQRLQRVDDVVAFSSVMGLILRS